jgi:general secretion pathway protein K
LREGRYHEGGFALVTALWAALILALVASFVLKAGFVDVRIAHTALRQGALRAAAQGAIAATELRLLSPAGVPGIGLDGLPSDIIVVDRKVTVAVQDQAGLIDLNFAPSNVLEHLFEATGLSVGDAQTLADRVLDWREKGAGHRLNGAKAPDYAAVGNDYGPREAPFESIAELRLVLGITTDIYNQVAPALTVCSQKPVVERSSAPLLALAALPGMTTESAASAVSDRQRAEQQGGFVSQPIVMAGRSLRITASVSDPKDGTSWTSSTVVRIIGSGTSLFWVYESRV